MDSGVPFLAFVVVAALLVAGTVVAYLTAKSQEADEGRAGNAYPQGQRAPEPPSIPEAKPISEASSVTTTASSPEPPRVRRIFLSYRRDDSADVAGRIYDRLTQAFEKAQVFKDVDSIPLGVDFRKHLQQTVESCDVLLAVIGERWLTAASAGGSRRIDDSKDFVRIELETALKRDIPVIPLLVRGATVPEEAELPPTLASFSYRNGISVRPDPDFHRDMDRLIQNLVAHLSEGQPAHDILGPVVEAQVR